jgi:hypothetical protein
MAGTDWDDQLVWFQEDVRRRQVLTDAATPEEPVTLPHQSRRNSAREQSRQQTRQRLRELEHALDLLDGAEGTEQVRQEIAQMRQHLGG